MRYRVAIVDDHKLFRMGVIAALEVYDDIEVVFEAGDGNELLQLLSTNKVDVILLDMKMPNKSGLEALRAIRLKDEIVKILVLSMHGDDEYISLMMDAQANGYLLKNADPSEIYDAIVSCINTGYYFNATINQLLLKNIIKLKRPEHEKRAIPADFTARELEVLQLLCEGKTTKEISSILCLGIRSIEGIKAAMQKRLEINSTVGLILYAIKHDLAMVKEN